jgi:hypothetical protein
MQNTTSLSYRDIPSKVIRYFERAHPNLAEKREEIFDDLLVFLSEDIAAKQVPSCDIDSAWHSFILHTREYMEFCHNRLGRFVHHVPFDSQDADRLSDCGSAGCSTDCGRIH